MNYYLTIFILFAVFNLLKSQKINDLIQETHVDSLIKTVKELSGEDSIFINGQKKLIKSREQNKENTLAALYIKKRLSGYNLEITSQFYSTSGENIIAIQKGALHPDTAYIICAHYDALSPYAADDNASSVAVVIEAARILSKKCFNYTIIYAFWDEEEIGLYGSNYYARTCSLHENHISGVFNLEMLAYDSNCDGKFDVRVNDSPNTLTLKNGILNIIHKNKLFLKPDIIYRDHLQSDHISFWEQDYAAIVISESFSTHDYNPYYQSVNDRLNLFNPLYYLEMAKLSIGAIALFAIPCIPEFITDTRNTNINIKINK